MPSTLNKPFRKGNGNEGHALLGLWSVPFVLDLIVIFAASITMTTFMPLLPIYFKKIGGDGALAGIVVSIFTVAALIFRPFFAVIVDRYGRKPVLVLGFILILIGCSCYRFASAMGVFFLIRIVHGAGYSASTNAAGAIAADLLPPERRSQGIGYYSFVMAASLALGPVFALLIMRKSGIKTSFLAASVVAAVGLAVSLLLSYERKGSLSAISPDERTKNTKFTEKRGVAAGYEKTALSASIVMFFVAIAYSCIVTFLPSYAASLGYRDISFYFIVYTIVLLVTRILVDRITRTRDISIVIIPGIVMMAGAFVLLGLGKSKHYFIAAAVLYAIGYGSVQPTLNAIIFSRCLPSRRGAANSTFFSLLDLGIGVGAALGGVVSQRYGYACLYFACVVTLVLAAMAYFLLMAGKDLTTKNVSDHS